MEVGHSDCCACFGQNWHRDLMSLINVPTPDRFCFTYSYGSGLFLKWSSWAYIVQDWFDCLNSVLSSQGYRPPTAVRISYILYKFILKTFVFYAFIFYYFIFYIPFFYTGHFLNVRFYAVTDPHLAGFETGFPYFRYIWIFSRHFSRLLFFRARRL